MEKDSLIQQLPDNYTEEVTLSKLYKSKNALTYGKINDILKSTNYYDLMEDFINDDERNLIEMRLSEDVDDELLAFDVDEIQKAVKNPFTFNQDQICRVWRYEKFFSWDSFTYMKRKPCIGVFRFVHCLFWIVWGLCFIFSIVWLVSMPSILTLIIAFGMLFAVIVPYLTDKEFRTRGYHLSNYNIDMDVVNKLPRVDFIQTA